MQRISHQPTDRDKAFWKRVALLVLMAIWLFPGVMGRGPWKPDEPLYFGVLHSMFTVGGDAWWIPEIGGALRTDELPFLHWINAAFAWLPSLVLPLHEAARVSSAVWIAIAAASLALAARRWSQGNISYLAAIILLGCAGLYLPAHHYIPENGMVAALSLAIYGIAELADHRHRATALLVVATIIGFAAFGALGLFLLLLPLLLLAFAPVTVMYRISLARAIGFALLICGLLTLMWALRAPEAFNDWLNAGAGLSLKDRQQFRPQTYGANLLWFAWPAWPIAIWTLILRFRGFAGGWQRAEIVAPIVYFCTAVILLNAFTEPRTIHTMFLLPPLVILAAFGVDTIRRTWYAMIDWFGILVLGMMAAFLFLLSCAIYFKTPVALAKWIERFVPAFNAPTPWLGFGIAAVAVLIWLALVQPAHQHSRRALINWVGCVTFLWVVAHTLLSAPANYVISHRAALEALNRAWPNTGCVNALNLAPSETALLFYHANRTAEPIDELGDATCPHLLIERYQGKPAAPDPSKYRLLMRTARPGNSSETFELYTQQNSGTLPAAEEKKL